MKTKTLLFGLAILFVPLFARATEHSAGTNVISNGTVYMVTPDHTLRAYTSAGAFLSYGFNTWSGVQTANADDLKLPAGNFIPPRDGGITCSDRGDDKNTCYLITDGKKAGFTSAEVFIQLGFKFEHSLVGDVSFLPSTSNISESTQSHLPGTLINDNGTVKLLGKDGAVGVPSVDTLKSWGYSLDDVVPANAEDKKIEQIHILPPHELGELVPKMPPPCRETDCPPLPVPAPTPIPCASLTPTTSLKCEPVFPPPPMPCATTSSISGCPVPEPTPSVSPNLSAVKITGLTPTSGFVGTAVTIVGSGFTPTNNYVLFGLGVLPGVASSTDGKTLQFIVPISQRAYCASAAACPEVMQLVATGYYNVRVANANGMSDAMGFTVTIANQ